MFERSGHLGGKGLMRDAIVLYYGKCRIQHFCILALSGLQISMSLTIFI